MCLLERVSSTIAEYVYAGFNHTFVIHHYGLMEGTWTFVGCWPRVHLLLKSESS